MNFLKKTVITILCLGLITLSLFTVNAAAVPNISISTKTADLGDTVVIDINISNNPGIMGMAFCIVYDSDSLSFESYEKGYISSCTLKDHSDKGHVSFVNIEGSDKTNNGKIISLSFKVKSNAKSGSHPIYLANSDRQRYGNKLNNSFANSNQDYIFPTVTAGGIIVPGICQTEHKFGSWHTTKKASCAESGLKNRTCEICNYNEEVIVTVPHDFEAEWTIDKAATPNMDGEMSRHCKYCDAVTDKVVFSYEEIGDGTDTPEDNTSTDESSGDTTSSDNSSIDDESSDNSPTVDTSSNTSSTNNSSTDNYSESVTTTTSSDSTQSGNKPSVNERPNINNSLGEKVPLEEVEKLEDYQQNTDKKPTKDDLSSNSNSNQPSSSKMSSTVSTTTNPDTSSQSVSSNNKPSHNTSSAMPSKPTGVESNINSATSSKPDSDTIDSNDWLDEDDSFFDTPTGILVIVVCSLLSVGIIALGIILILKNKKQ